jgi:hypothetical protein
MIGFKSNTSLTLAVRISRIHLRCPEASRSHQTRDDGIQRRLPYRPPNSSWRIKSTIEHDERVNATVFADHRKVKRPGVICRNGRAAVARASAWDEGHGDSLEVSRREASGRRAKESLQRKGGAGWDLTALLRRRLSATGPRRDSQGTANRSWCIGWLGGSLSIYLVEA